MRQKIFAVNDSRAIYGTLVNVTSNKAANRLFQTIAKNLWKSIVQHKILNQASVLEYFFPDNKNIERLKILAKDTLSDDARNHEGMAAALYFKSLFGKKFVRNRLNPDINILLNYAYTILRAMVARAVSGNGLLPYLGLKHCGKTNSLPLVDDLIEPFRAIADKLVFDEVNKIINIDNIELNAEIKRNLAKLIVFPAITGKGAVTLNDAIYDFVGSLVSSFEDKKYCLNILNMNCQNKLDMRALTV